MPRDVFDLVRTFSHRSQTLLSPRNHTPSFTETPLDLHSSRAPGISPTFRPLGRTLHYYAHAQRRLLHVMVTLHGLSALAHVA